MDLLLKKEFIATVSPMLVDASSVASHWNLADFRQFPLGGGGGGVAKTLLLQQGHNGNKTS